MTEQMSLGLKWVLIGAGASLLGRIGFIIFPLKDLTFTVVVSGAFFFGGIVVVLAGAILGICGIITRDRNR